MDSYGILPLSYPVVSTSRMSPAPIGSAWDVRDPSGLLLGDEFQVSTWPAEIYFNELKKDQSNRFGGLLLGRGKILSLKFDMARILAFLVVVQILVGFSSRKNRGKISRFDDV